MKISEKREYLEIVKEQGGVSEDTVRIINWLINIGDEIKKYGVIISILLSCVIIFEVIILIRFW